LPFTPRSSTVRHIQGTINSIDDLPGRHVGTAHNSTAAAYLRDLKAQVREFEDMEDAYKALLDKQIDAVVFDAPVLLYYAAHAGKGRVQVVGGPLTKRITASYFQPIVCCGSKSMSCCCRCARTAAMAEFTTNGLAPNKTEFAYGAMC
jgi:ABC-type amino acid transport substrate-binding protein